MEAINALCKLYKAAEEKLKHYEKEQAWEKSDIKFKEPPVCVTYLLQNGVMELGSINMCQFRLAAYFKTQDINALETTALLDEWLHTIPATFIEEFNPVTGEVDYTHLRRQNKSVVMSVYSGSSYGFSCGGMRQIPGVKNLCTEECKKQTEQKFQVTLFDAGKAEYRGKRLTLEAEVIGRYDTPYIIPGKVVVECSGQRTTEMCEECPLSFTSGKVEYEISASSPYILDFLEPSNIPLSGKIKRLVNLPKQCYRWRHNVVEINMEKIYIAPRLANEAGDSDRYVRESVYYLGHGIKTNQAYKFSGFSHVNDKTGAVRLVFDSTEELEDSLSEFKWTQRMQHQSLVFRPKNRETILSKHKEIVRNLSRNHIRVWGRDDMIMAVDLAYHSVRRFWFQGRKLKGWLDILLIGDSGQAKTLVVESLKGHYDLGFKAAGESAGRTGLLWAIESSENKPHYIIWGSLARYNGRIVIVDELKHLIEKGGFADLTEARSAGSINVQMVTAGRALCETRLILISNPIGRRQMSSYMFGIEAIQDLIPDYEDIRRFDIAVAVASNEIEDEIIHRDIDTLPELPDIYTSEICKQHLLWVWNLEPDDVEISKAVETHILKRSLALCGEYISTIPIVEPADQREKLARLAVAFAARMFLSPNGEKLSVTHDAVDAAYDYMNTLYTSDGMKYHQYSEAYKKLIIDDDAMKQFCEEFVKHPDFVLIWEQVVWYMIRNNWIKTSEMAMTLGIPRTSCTNILSWLSAANFIDSRRAGSYVKTPNGVLFFSALMPEDGYKKPMTAKEIDNEARSVADTDHFEEPKEGEEF